ncbi:MAG: hypothetical protein AAFZ15_13780 [Bacteroidota bacterium]
MEAKTEIKGYTQAPKEILLDSTLSSKAKMIFAYMLSRPNSWKFFINEMMKHFKEGKSAIQSALQELSQRGYVQLVTIRNESTHRVEGKRYVLNKSVCQSLRPTVSPTMGISVQRENATYNHKEENKKEININNQQQKSGKQAVAAEGKFINFFFEKIIEDTKWFDQFTSEPLGNDFFKNEQLRLLLFRFKDSSLKGAKFYKNRGEVKKHFRHWFHLKKKKEELLIAINEERIQQRRITENASNLMIQSQNYLIMRSERSFPRPEVVLKAREKLIVIARQLNSTQARVYDSEIIENIQQRLEGLTGLIDDINRGENANRLDWFCQNAQLKNKN